MILVIGYGNSLCGDDGIGPRAVERLAEENLLADVECLTAHQLMPELAETISCADAVIFVDAAYAETPGKITCLELAPVNRPDTAPAAFTHHVSPAILLENAQILYGRHPAAYLYTIAGENFELGDSFSSGVELTLPSLLEQLKARIAQCANSESPNPLIVG
jgi:hydrogenase maturation protease